MARPRKWENDSQRRQAQNDERKARRQKHDVHFVGVDGEGIGRGRNHKYVLLGIGNKQVENPDGLRFAEICEHLWECYEEEPDSAYVGFFLGYDFTQWFKTLPESRARMLLTEQGRQKRRRIKNPQLGPFPVSYDGWDFDILGMKRFKLRPEGKTGSWLYVCDAGPFFQASLMTVIDPKKWDQPIVTENEYAILEEGKRNRDTASLDSRTRNYNALENAVLARLMDRTNAGLVQAGIRLRKNQWFGPGQAAQHWLSNIGAPSGSDVREITGRADRNGTLASPAMRHGPGNDTIHERTRLTDAARSSYYGGWFEIMAHGHIPGPSWEYDINSAYPYIISRLPCLLHGSWRETSDGSLRRHGSDSRNTLLLARGFCQGSNSRIGAMLHRRNDHSIVRPHRTGGWYWGHEISAAIRAGLIDSFEFREGWEYDGCDCKPPMRGIAGLYEHRLQVGKNTPQGKGSKLVYNSVYGKFAQSVGEPKYGNPFYASLITAGCRTMILDAIATHPEGTNAVLMVATDGVYFRSRTNALAISHSLGDWEESVHSNLTLFKPGFYWDDSTRKAIQEGRNPTFKARGINAASFANQISIVDAHFSRWPERFPHERDPEGPREGWYPSVKFTSGFSMVTCQQAIQRGKWFLAGAVGTQELVQDADPIQKRHSGQYENGIFWSRPFADGGGTDLESTPYDRKFGQPDPDEYGINDDGTVKDQWARLILARLEAIVRTVEVTTLQTQTRKAGRCVIRAVQASLLIMNRATMTMMKWISKIRERFLVATILVTSSVALIAFLASYQHQYELVIHNNQTHWVGALYPLSDDLLIVAATMVLWHATNQGWKRPWGVWLILAVGIAASAIANRADDHSGWGHIGAYISVWPAVAFLGAFESTIWVIRRKHENKKDNDDTVPAMATTETSDRTPIQVDARRSDQDSRQVGPASIANGHGTRTPILRKVDKPPGKGVS